MNYDTTNTHPNISRECQLVAGHVLMPDQAQTSLRALFHVGTEWELEIVTVMAPFDLILSEVSIRSRSRVLGYELDGSEVQAKARQLKRRDRYVPRKSLWWPPQHRTPAVLSLYILTTVMAGHIPSLLPWHRRAGSPDQSEWVYFWLATSTVVHTNYGAGERHAVIPLVTLSGEDLN
ncbi:hypothetical protein H4582DRAFT_562038 [Lactarius indigo]|nr:hypothetical protein H4582DRAFT_562038 [Lactarius indigo]